MLFISYLTLYTFVRMSINIFDIRCHEFDVGNKQILKFRIFIDKFLQFLGTGNSFDNISSALTS